MRFLALQVRYFVSPRNKDPRQEYSVEWHQDPFMQVLVCLYLGPGASKVFWTHPRIPGEDGFFIGKKPTQGFQEFSLKVGDVLFIPSRYPHSVTTIGETVTINFGFISNGAKLTIEKTQKAIKDEAQQTEHENRVNPTYPDVREISSVEHYTLI